MKECSMLISSIVYPLSGVMHLGGDFYNHICIKLISLLTERT